MAMRLPLPDLPLAPHKRRKPRRIKRVVRPAAQKNNGRARYAPSVVRGKPARKPAKKRQWLSADSRLWWGVITPVLIISVLVIASTAVLLLTAGLAMGDRILPGISTSGINVGGMTEPEAAALLDEAWRTLTLSDGTRTWHVDAAALGIEIDAATTAEHAYAQGRSEGPRLQGLLTRVDIPVVVSLDFEAARAGLDALQSEVGRVPVNASIRLVNGRVEAVPATNGRALNIEATLDRLQDTSVLTKRQLELVMDPVIPTVADASPLVAEAERLLANPIDFQLYDPVTGDTALWTATPETWNLWLSAVPDASSTFGLALSLDESQVAGYLNAQAAQSFDPSRYIKTEEIIASVNETLQEGHPAGYVRVYHHDRQHAVQPGETWTSIAWDYGIPYLYLQQANEGRWLSTGQNITIPSADNFFDYPVVPGKRIEVSIREQRVRVYEDGALKWDWPASTGIADSPTWRGIYQIISHYPNAYASNWDLHMPNFMGVYRPIPGADFTNGFHGFPTRGGSQLLWTNSLGTRVTYGCILLSNQNSKALYDWAEEGVVVEID